MAEKFSVATGDWDQTSTWADTTGGTPGASVPVGGDDAIVEGGFTVTMTDAATVGSLTIEEDSTVFDQGGYTLTLDDKDGNGFSFYLRATSTYTHNDGLVKFAGTGSSQTYYILTESSSENFYDVEIDSSSNTYKVYTGPFECDNNFTITAGTFNTNGGDGDQSLTVTLDIHIDGTLTGNTSAISARSVHIDGTFTHNGVLTVTGIAATNYAFQNLGTWTPATSQRTTFTGGAGTFYVKSNDWNAVTIVANNSANYYFSPKTGTGITWTAYITVTTGSMYQNANGDSWVVGGNVLVSDDYLGVSTATGDLTFASLTIASGGTFNATRGTTTITGAVGSNFAINNGGTFTHNGGTIDFTGSVQQQTNDGLVLHNVICNNSHSNGLIYRNNTMNNLTVNASKNMSFYSGGGAITVNGDATISGYFNKNGSASASGAYSFGSLTIASGGTYYATSGTTTIYGSSGGFAILDEGTFTHNGGTVHIDYETSNLNSSTRIHQNGAKKINNLEIEMNRTTDEVTLSVASGTSQGLAGTFTLTKGEAMLYNNDHAFDVDGAFLVDANGTWGAVAHTGAHEFAGVKIVSGGTFIATSGTTTVTNRFTGTSNLWKNDGGTFTHNNGTVKFTDNDHSLIKELTFYNLEAASSLGDYALSWETSSGTACTILGDLTITRGDFEIHAAGNTLDVYGQTIINGASNSGARFNNDKNQTGTITHHGLVTIIQGTYHVEDGGTVNMAGIRNVGGLVD